MVAKLFSPAPYFSKSADNLTVVRAPFFSTGFCMILFQIIGDFAEVR